MRCRIWIFSRADDGRRVEVWFATTSNRMPKLSRTVLFCFFSMWMQSAFISFKWIHIMLTHISKTYICGVSKSRCHRVTEQQFSCQSCPDVFVHSSGFKGVGPVALLTPPFTSGFCASLDIWSAAFFFSAVNAEKVKISWLQILGLGSKLMKNNKVVLQFFTSRTKKEELSTLWLI